VVIVVQFLQSWWAQECHVLSLCSLVSIVEKARENGENVTSFRGIAFVASDMGWP